MVPLVFCLLVIPSAALQQPQWWGRNSSNPWANAATIRQQRVKAWYRNQQAWYNGSAYKPWWVRNTNNRKKAPKNTTLATATPVANQVDNPRYTSQVEREKAMKKETESENFKYQLDNKTVGSVTEFDYKAISKAERTFMNRCRQNSHAVNVAQCQPSYNVLYKMLQKVSNVKAEIDSIGHIDNDDVQADYYCLNNFTNMFSWMESLAVRRTFNSVWYKVSGGYGTIDQHRMRKRPLQFTRILAKCVMDLGDDDHNGFMTRQEFVNFIHAGSYLTPGLFQGPPVPFSKKLINCWAGVLHNKVEEVNGVRCA